MAQAPMSRERRERRERREGRETAAGDAKGELRDPSQQLQTIVEALETNFQLFAIDNNLN